MWYGLIVWLCRFRLRSFFLHDGITVQLTGSSIVDASFLDLLFLGFVIFAMQSQQPSARRLRATIQSQQPSARREPGLDQPSFPFAPPPGFTPIQEAAFVLPHETPTSVRFNPGDPGVGLQWCCDVVNLVQWPRGTGKEMKWAVARALQQVVLPFMYDYCEYRRTSQAHLLEVANWNQLLVLQLQAHLDEMSSRMIEVQERARIAEHSMSVQLGKIYQLQDEVKVLRELASSQVYRSTAPVDIKEAVRRAQVKAYRIRGGANVSVASSRSGIDTPVSLLSWNTVPSGASTPITEYHG